MITVLLVLALARSRRGQRVIQAITSLITIAWQAFLPIIVELGNLARSIRHLPHRWRDHHDRDAAR